MGHVTLAVERSGTVIADMLFASESKSGDRFTFSGIKRSFLESVIKRARIRTVSGVDALFVMNTNPKQCFTKNTEGSPPRVRGKQEECSNENYSHGITPACAGKTPQIPRPARVLWDYPRVCGENVKSLALIAERAGSPPRVRGKCVCLI